MDALLDGCWTDKAAPEVTKAEGWSNGDAKGGAHPIASAPHGPRRPEAEERNRGKGEGQRTGWLESLAVAGAVS